MYAHIHVVLRKYMCIIYVYRSARVWPKDWSARGDFAYAVRVSLSVLVNGHGWRNMNRPSVCSESALCPSFLKPLCSVVAIVTVVLVVNVALIRWPHSRQNIPAENHWSCTSACSLCSSSLHILYSSFAILYCEFHHC